MAVEIWDSSEQIGTFQWQELPQPGDVIELDVEGEVNPYTVEKVVKFYAHRSNGPTQRIVVSYSGPMHFSVV